MQQLSRTCQVANHQIKPIEYVCTYSQCQLSRFLCSKCALEATHKHDQQDISHIVDNIDFYEKIKNNLQQAKDNQQQKNYDTQKSIVPLKQLMQEIQNLLKNIQNIIQQVEQGKLKNDNFNHLENQLLNIQKYGFNLIDDQQLNNLINIPVQQQDQEIYKQLEDYADSIIQNALKIKEWRFQQVENKQSLQQLQKIKEAKYQIIKEWRFQKVENKQTLSQSQKIKQAKYQIIKGQSFQQVENKQSLSQLQKIKEAKYQIHQIDDTGDNQINTGAISKDLKYIVSGGNDKLLKIWDYQSNQLIKSIELDFQVWSCKFTEDSTLLYAGSYQNIYQFDVQNQFKELQQQTIHNNNFIYCIYCITNTIILTSSYETIIKTDVDKIQQLLKIEKAHNSDIYGLDYNMTLSIIASGSDNKSIKLWNGNDGSLIIEKFNAHDSRIRQVLFISNNNQLISLDLLNNLIIWNINYEKKQLEQLQLIKNSGENISLVLEQQYMIATGKKFIKVYSIKGEFVRQFDHEVDQVFMYNTVQLDSMKAVLIEGEVKLQVCKLDMD